MVINVPLSLPPAPCLNGVYGYSPRCSRDLPKAEDPPPTQQRRGGGATARARLPGKAGTLPGRGIPSSREPARAGGRDGFWGARARAVPCRANRAAPLRHPHQGLPRVSAPVRAQREVITSTTIKRSRCTAQQRSNVEKVHDTRTHTQTQKRKDRKAPNAFWTLSLSIGFSCR